MADSDFVLHPQLARDTLLLGDLALCRVLLNSNELLYLD